MRVFNKIKLNSEITINNERFKCTEIVEYTYIEGRYTEYKLKSINGKKVNWLEVEDGEAYLYKSINNTEFNNFKDRYSNGKSYSGTAKVKSFSEDSDVDLDETVSFIEIYSDDEEDVISMETWEDGEVEYSLGKYIDINDIIVEELYNSNYNYNFNNNSNYSFNKNSKKKLVIGLVIGVAIVSFIIGSVNRKKNCGQFNCKPSNPAWCCTNTIKCSITNDYCESIKHSNSIRHRSLGFRRPVGGGTSFGK